MHDLLVLTFDSAEAAAGARGAVKKLQHDRLLVLEDAAVLRCDEKGKIHVDNELSRDVKVGAGVGAMLGLLLTFLFPLAGLVFGTAGGALVGASLDHGIDRKFVNDVKQSLKPNHSALFLVVEQGDLSALRAALAPYHGDLIQTTLDEEVANQIRRSSKQ